MQVWRANEIGGQRSHQKESWGKEASGLEMQGDLDNGIGDVFGRCCRWFERRCCLIEVELSYGVRVQELAPERPKTQSPLQAQLSFARSNALEESGSGSGLLWLSGFWLWQARCGGPTS